MKKLIILFEQTKQNLESELSELLTFQKSDLAMRFLALIAKVITVLWYYF